MNKFAALLCVLLCFCVTQAQAKHRHKQADPEPAVETEAVSTPASPPKEYICPGEIHIKPNQAESAPGLTLWTDPQVKTQLLGISLYNGPPTELAQLKPDNGDDPQAKEYSWSVYDNPHGYWMVCSYSNTAQRFTQQLGSHRKSCVTKMTNSIATSLKCE